MNRNPKSKKGEVQISNISSPYGFTHAIHVGEKTYQERSLDTEFRQLSPRQSNNNSTDGISLKTLNEKLNALTDVIVENIQIKVAEPIRKTQAHILVEVQAINDTFQSLYTQTTTERGKIEEVEESVNDRTMPKYLLKEMTHSEPSQSITQAKTNKQGDMHDNISKTPMSLDYGRYSLQLREVHVSSTQRPKSSMVVKRVCDERECLANAIQSHVEDLVDGIIFHESELPDCLLADGCLTEDECATVRKLRDRKDQVRVLLSLIKGRDFRVLQGFMKHIEQHNEDVAFKITEKFENNKRKGVRRKICYLCQLEKQFNVKHVVDSLWAIQIIDDGLYNSIIYSEAPVGAQEALWKKVIHSLNSLDPQTAELAHIKLLTSLRSKNLFTHLADGIENMLIKNHGKLTCFCEPKMFPLKRNTFQVHSISEESFFPESSSDGIPDDGASSVDTCNVSVTHDGSHNKLTSTTDDQPHRANTSLIADNQPKDNIHGAISEEPLSSNQAQPTSRWKPAVPKKPVLDYTSRVKLITSHAEQSAPRMKPVVPKKPVLDGITRHLKIASSNTAWSEESR